jgi:hypothetical protein
MSPFAFGLRWLAIMPAMSLVRSRLLGVVALALVPSLALAQDPAADPAATTTTSGLPEETPEETPEELPPEVPEAEQAQFGLGVRLRYGAAPTSIINLFPVSHSTPASLYGVAASLVRRKGNLDIGFTVQYDRIDLEAGLWQEDDEDPSIDGMYPDFVECTSCSFLAFDVSFTWHARLTEWLAFRYGAGIGIGVPLQNATQTDTSCPASTTNDDLDNPMHCAREPSTTVDADVPPVLPVIQFMVGFRFKVMDKLSFNIEGGLRDVLSAGVGIDYFF